MNADISQCDHGAGLDCWRCDAITAMRLARTIIGAGLLLAPFWILFLIWLTGGR